MILKLGAKRDPGLQIAPILRGGRRETLKSANSRRVAREIPHTDSTDIPIRELAKLGFNIAASVTSIDYVGPSRNR
jgi:hypothetical protein